MGGPQYFCTKWRAFLACISVSLLIRRASSLQLALAGKRALVTGSSGGIGAGIAIKLAAEGAHVLVHYHNRRDGAHATADAIVTAGGSCAGIVQCDFRSPDAIVNMMEGLSSIWGDGFDILINNAGIVTKLAMQDDDESLSTWHETMAVNLHAPIQLSRLAHSRMKGRKGVIVNVSSIHGARSVEFMTAYAASKAALDSVTRGLALEYASDEIRVNGIAPGVVPVERTAEVFANPDTTKMWIPHLPAGRLGTVQDIADAVLPLCTNEWVTGAIWTIDGGMTARSNMPMRPRPKPADSDEQEQCISKLARFEEL
jgi:glucose 1-dehydrogenase